MKAEPLSKAIYDKAKSLGINHIGLHFSGGSDEGHLYVETKPEYDREFADEIEEWVWENYHYSGAGDGNEYGDNITYNLETNEVTTQEWYHVMVMQEEEAQTSTFKVE